MVIIVLSLHWTLIPICFIVYPRTTPVTTYNQRQFYLLNENYILFTPISQILSQSCTKHQVIERVYHYPEIVLSRGGNRVCVVWCGVVSDRV
jgi:hypothetical protein